MPRPRRAAKARSDELVGGMELELHIGPRWGGPADDFVSEDHARRVYFRHREALLEPYLLARKIPGDRPEAFWWWEAPPELRHADGHDVSARRRLEEARVRWLHGQGLLTEAERAALLAEAARAVAWLDSPAATSALVGEHDPFGPRGVYEQRVRIGHLVR